MPCAGKQRFTEKATAKKAMCMEKSSTGCSEKQIASASSFASLSTSKEQQPQWFSIKF